jgi:hypothetical protein
MRTAILSLYDTSRTRTIVGGTRPLMVFPHAILFVTQSHPIVECVGYSFARCAIAHTYDVYVELPIYKELISLVDERLFNFVVVKIHILIVLPK